MFLNELSPLFQEFVQQPLAFTGGFFSGVFRLSLDEDPLKSWLEQQSGSNTSQTNFTYNGDNGRTSGPQSISIE
ncbi:hypothetical protein [Oscillatoria salina]|uniref:hypothetical protein n=1 Tax=Oscillatoria salina TaxID=331517 RepID=UPI0013BBE077|nr:hypothetical protein [Oscillatoria salina]MBZ8182620.1 hypothetical protein [Oscillatoria salina IIICB1]NET87412.1 hypothetical protein [Kamptonema sp. SIO1D9]